VINGQEVNVIFLSFPFIFLFSFNDGWMDGWLVGWLGAADIDFLFLFLLRLPGGFLSSFLSFFL
jgi:hypothetical protein